jgi:PAS domain S-box-containing protein
VETEKTILLVEDQAIIALSERKTLERHGFRVLTATAGEKALELVRSEQDIDLILMDIDLGPGMDGTEAAVLILAERELPLIFLSSHSEKEVVDKTEGITSYGYIVKNSGEMVLAASIRMAFRLFEAKTEAKQTGRKLQALLDAVPDRMFVADAEGRTSDFQETGDVGSLFSPGELDRFPECCRRCIETGETQSFIHTGDGETEGRSFDIRLARIDGAHALVIVRDVTEKHRKELRMKKIAQAIRQSPSTVVITDADANIEYVNPKFTELTGYLPEEVVGSNPRILKSGLTPDTVYRELWDTVTSGQEWRGSFRNRKKNGDIYYESASISPVRDRHNRLISYIAVKEDITDRVLAEEALVRCEMRFKVLADAAPVLIWEADTEKLCTWFNSQWLAYTGRTMEQEYGNGWTGGVHPDDLDFCLRTFSDAFDAREPFRMEYRLRRGDGRYGWVYDQGRPRYDEGGGFTGYLGACTDITELKESRDALLEKGEFLRILFDQARDNIMIHEVLEDGRPGDFIHVNESTCRTLGYTREELMKMSPLDTANSVNGSFVIEMLKDIVRTGSVRFEAEGKTKDGRLIPFELQVSHMKVGNRDLVMAISRDISER